MHRKQHEHEHQPAQHISTHKIAIIAMIASATIAPRAPKKTGAKSFIKFSLPLKVKQETPWCPKIVNFVNFSSKSNIVTLSLDKVVFLGV